MPCTFSHPLAVIPLYCVFRRHLNLTALVIGSMSPDFAYYVSLFSIATFAHTTAGTLIVCLPTGLMALAIFLKVRQPICFLLPQPHRSALWPLTRDPSFVTPRSFLAASVSVLVGAWTHTVWDSFTHAAAWPVQRLPLLREPIFWVGNVELHGYYVLQQISSLVGAVVLAGFYLHWLRQQPKLYSRSTSVQSESWRYLLIGLMAVFAVGCATPFALRVASHYDGYFGFRVFVFRCGVYSAAIFGAAFVGVSLALASWRRRHEVSR